MKYSSWLFGATRRAAWIGVGTFSLACASFLNVPTRSPGRSPNSSLEDSNPWYRHGISWKIPCLRPSSSSSLLACSVASISSEDNARRKTTLADAYYAKHGRIPRPSIMHASLQDLAEGFDTENFSNILVIGDIHGCKQELDLLIEKAEREQNGGRPFSYILLVGDLCNKGPESAEVIRWARTTPNVFSVRGNHDDGALAAALGDTKRRNKKKYEWVMKGETSQEDANQKRDSSGNVALSDGDVHWLSELPYSIRIPGVILKEPEDTIIVHAGIIPGIPLKEQGITTMITIREVLPTCNGGLLSGFQFYEREKGNPATATENPRCNVPIPWASAWKGPERFIFGHDARRGLQRYEGDFAIGLDTGAVYGKQLSGMILPGRKLVSVQSSEYSPVGEKD